MRSASRRARWKSDPSVLAPAWLDGRDGEDLLDAGQIATLYRALRKAGEDDKDEAGAGDMEMRRHSRASSRGKMRGRGDRATLRAYLVCSGYGLRPARTLVSLAVTVGVGAILLWWVGFHQPRTFGRSVLFAIESSVSLLRAPDAGLSAGGQIIQIILRLLGPLFVGLALLAVRARVKR